MMTEQLAEVRAWAHDKLRAGTEPPWAWQQYTKLVEAIDAITAGRESVNRTASSPQSVERQGTHLRLVGSTCRADAVQHHPSDAPVQVPM